MAAREKFCCVCGMAGDFENYLCPRCGTASKSTETKQKNPASVCKRCGRFLVKGRWLPPSAVDTIKGDYPRLITCQDCYRALSGYYEAITQFSTYSGNFSNIRQDIEKRMLNLIELENKLGKMVEITKVENNNYYFNNLRAAKRIAKKLAKYYGGKIRETSKLVGVDRSTSKEKRRVTLLITLSNDRTERMP